jgi:spermidine synthase
VDVAWNTNYFTYLSESRAAISVALGDARRMLTAETNRYDVLVIDAYSGDSIPFHLATKEAFQLYFDCLKPGGILAMHITNWHLDLKPLCKAVAKAWNLQLTGVDSEEADLCFSAMWVFICNRPLPVEPRESVSEIDWEQVRDIALPTDACGSLINLISYRE